MANNEDANAMDVSSQDSATSDDYFADESEKGSARKKSHSRKRKFPRKHKFSRKRKFEEDDSEDAHGHEVAKPRSRINRPRHKWARLARKTKKTSAKPSGQDADVKDAEATDPEDEDAFDDPPDQIAEAIQALTGSDRQKFLIKEEHSRNEVEKWLEDLKYVTYENVPNLYFYRRIAVVQLFDDHWIFAIVAKRDYHAWRYKLQWHMKFHGSLPDGQSGPLPPHLANARWKAR